MSRTALDRVSRITRRQTGHFGEESFFGNQLYYMTAKRKQQPNRPSTEKKQNN